jgi:hypothetical protein
MKYYCKNTRLEYSDYPCNKCGYPFNDFVRVCTTLPQEIPEYETIPQWKARKGKKYPNTAPVYVHYQGEWLLHDYKFASTVGYFNPYIVATEAGAPPNDWKPKEDVKRKVTKKKIKKIALEVWEYLRDHQQEAIYKNKNGLPKAIFFKIKYLCDLCDICDIFVAISNRCPRDCPIYPCFKEDTGLIYRWRRAESPQDRQIIAAKIVSLLQTWEPEEDE